MTPVPVEKLHECWERVEQGLYAIRNRRGEPWLPADVYVQLRMKTAFLLLIEDAGFLIYQILPGDDFRGVLHIWIAYGKLQPHEAAIYKDLDEFAKKLGVARIRLIGRKGWGRFPYWKPAGYVFEHEVT